MNLILERATTVLPDLLKIESKFTIIKININSSKLFKQY